MRVRSIGRQKAKVTSSCHVKVTTDRSSSSLTGSLLYTWETTTENVSPTIQSMQDKVTLLHIIYKITHFTITEHCRSHLPRYGMTGSLVEFMYSRSFCLLLFSENRSAIFSYVILSRFDTVCHGNTHTKLHMDSYGSNCCQSVTATSTSTRLILCISVLFSFRLG